MAQRVAEQSGAQGQDGVEQSPSPADVIGVPEEAIASRAAELAAQFPGEAELIGRSQTVRSLVIRVLEAESANEAAGERIDALMEQLGVDGLTQIPNRIAFFRKLDAIAESHRQQKLEIEGARMQRRRLLDGRTGTPLERIEVPQNPCCMMIIDIDHFKAVNDQHGHPAGDQVLCEVAARLHNCLHRPGDMAARIGGEEFGVLAVNTHGREAELAEILRGAIADKPIFVKGGPREGIRVTISIGVSPWVESHQDMYGRADRAMYAAKLGTGERDGQDMGNGRNQIWIMPLGVDEPERCEPPVKVP